MISINDSLIVASQKNVDGKAFDVVNNKSVPYSSVAAFLSKVPVTRRHIGMIVFIYSEGGKIERYQFVTGIADTDLKRITELTEVDFEYLAKTVNAQIIAISDGTTPFASLSLYHIAKFQKIEIDKPANYAALLPSGATYVSGQAAPDFQVTSEMLQTNTIYIYHDNNNVWGISKSEKLAFNILDEKKVDKVDGKTLSTNDYTEEDKRKVQKIKTDGNEDKYLSETGEYREVKAPIRSLSVNGEDVEPDDAGKVTIEIPKEGVQEIVFNGEKLDKDSEGQVHLNINTNVEQTINPASTNPVSAAAVAAEFEGLSARYGSALSLNEVGDGEDKKYSVSLMDENGNVLSTSDEWAGGGGGGGGETSTTRIVLAKVSENPTVKNGDRVELTYYYDHRDIATNSSTGLQGDIIITVIAGATSRVITKRINADSNDTINVSDMLLVGNNTVRVRASVNTGESLQVSTISFRVQVITLQLTSGFDFARIYNRGQQIALPYSLSGSGNKTLKLYLDGVEIDARTLSTSSANGSFTIDTSALSHGSHSLQMVAGLAVSESVTLKSNSIYFDVAIAGGGNAPIVATRFDYKDGTTISPGQRPFVQARQFEEAKIHYAAYTPGQPTTAITLNIDGNTVSSANTTFRQLVTTIKLTQHGTLPGFILAGGTKYTFNLQVLQSDINLNEPTDNRVFKLSALGRSNNDSDRDEWVNNGITTTMTGIQFSGDGWTGNSLRLANDGKAVINYKPLSVGSADVQNAFAFTTKFKADSAMNTTIPVISCMQEGVGFQITPEEVKMVSNGNSEVTMKLAPGIEYNIAFVSHPASTTTSSAYEKLNENMLYLYIDGIMSGGVQRVASDNIYQANPVNITLQGGAAILDVYNVRAYNSYLSPDQILAIYILDKNNLDDILATYNRNAVVDSEGDVTIESLPKDARYVIITGEQENGMSTLQYASAINDKNARYDVTDILHVKKDQPELNFRCIGGCIRLQGTSSLAYPIKNFRIYFKNAAGVFGDVYEGVDGTGAGGTKNPDPAPKFSFRLPDETGKRPAPVNVWCLKADYAESSSSHNTGMAKLANRTLKAAGDYTPPQEDVLTTHPYDVRTTVDGDPCYLFYRKTLSDAPVFAGKYNFNNDKSTEEVFGFRDVPGYHDASWVAEKFGGKNPTECWEFLNNDYPMGMYLDDDFDRKEADGKPSWLLVFEARFPDDKVKNAAYAAGTLKPQYLEAFVKWVKSTQNNTAKFKSELAQYVDVKHLCSYYVFTQLFGAVDQMVKNAMLAFWYDPDAERMLGYYIFYDNDTILGVRNDGRLKYNWDINRQTLDPELTAAAGENKYAYAGHDSILWNNLESQFATEINTAYVRLRARMTNEVIFNVFDKEQSDRFVERIFNLDAQYKYVKPKTEGMQVIINGAANNVKYSYLEAMQGSRKAHRRWWLTNRLELFDAKFGTGQYTQTDIAWKGVSEPGAKISAVASRDFYFELRREAAVMARSFVPKEGTFEYTYGQSANVGTIFHLYGGKFMQKLDLSAWGGFTDINFPTLNSMKELIMGRAGKTYTLSEFVIGDKMPMLTKLDITNYTVLPGLNLTGCKRLETLIAKGCTSLASLDLATGSPVKSLVLPAALKTLSLKGLPYLKNSGITFPNGNSIITLIVEDSPNIDWEALLASLGPVKNIRIAGLNITGSRALLDKYINLGGVDEKGNIVSTPRLAGTFKLNVYLDDDVLEFYKQKYPELNILQPDYSTYIIYDQDPATGIGIADPANVYNPANYTGYGTNKPYKVSGHLSKILSKRHRYLGKQDTAGIMTLCQLHDKNSNYYNDHVNPANATPALLDGTDGDIWVKEPHYWYKGVTDCIKKVTYACFSSNLERPATPTQTVSMSYDQALAQENILNNKKIIQKTDTNTSNVFNDRIDSDASFFMIVSFDVAGYKKIKVCSTPEYNKDVCSVFVDANGNIISEIILTRENYSPGADIILDVPSNAAQYKATLPNDHKSFVFTKTNSNEITDLEPDWVEHKEVLVCPFTTKDINNKLRGVIGGTYTPVDVAATKTLLASRGFKTASYQVLKDIMNLAFLSCGCRLANMIFGSDAGYQEGTSLNFGMRDTQARDSSRMSYYLDDAGDPIWANNCILGYEKMVIGEYIHSLEGETGGYGDLGVRNEDYLIDLKDDRKYYLNYTSSSLVTAKYLQWGKKLAHVKLGTLENYDYVTHYCSVFNGQYAGGEDGVVVFGGGESG